MPMIRQYAILLAPLPVCVVSAPFVFIDTIFGIEAEFAGPILVPSGGRLFIADDLMVMKAPPLFEDCRLQRQLSNCPSAVYRMNRERRAVTEANLNSAVAPKRP